MQAPTPPRSVLQSVRSLGENLFAGAQERLELASLELHEEKLRLVQTFGWIAAATFAVAMVFTFGSLTLVYACWESARLAVLAGLTLFYAAGATGIFFAFRRHLARQPRPFAATIDELRTDRSCFSTNN